MVPEADGDGDDGDDDPLAAVARGATAVLALVEISSAEPLRRAVLAGGMQPLVETWIGAW
jgi:hypothetical protein